MYRILVTDAETRKAFDVISIVISSFPCIPIIAGDVDDSKSNKRHLRSLFHCDVETLRVFDEEVFIDNLKTISEKYSEDKIVFLPMEEKTVVFFYNFLNIYGAMNFVSILPQEQVFTTLRDKGKLNEYCAKNGLGAPEFFTIPQLDTLTVDKYPILLKPCVGSGSEGQFRLYKPEDYTDEIKTIANTKPYLAQELIGNGHDVKGAFFFYNQNGFVDAYTHERIRTSPPTGGVTVLSRLSNNQEVIEEGKNILDKICWQGLIMLEFLYDQKTCKYKVIEANPRVWGSIMLSEYGGSHLLTNYIRSCIGKPLISECREDDCYIRWLFPVDLLNYIKHLGQIDSFWDFKNTCFINWSYASKASAIRFNLWNLFKFKNFKRFLRK